MDDKQQLTMKDIARELGDAQQQLSAPARNALDAFEKEGTTGPLYHLP